MDMIHFDLIILISEYSQGSNYYLLNKSLCRTIIMVEKGKYWKEKYNGFFKNLNKEYLILSGDYNWKREYIRIIRFNYWSKMNNKMKELCAHSEDSNNWNEIPKEIGNLTNLQLIYIGSNIEKIPKEISNLINLKILCLADNKIKEIPKEINNLTQLLILDLSNNIIDKFPEEINDLPNLRLKLIGKRSVISILSYTSVLSKNQHLFNSKLFLRKYIDDSV